MNKPRLLDAFCGAGGCTRGYQLAGFHVTGVDIEPQPRYVGDAFIQGDALDFIRERGHEFDAIHASPPCQQYSRLRTIHKREYADLVDPTRDALLATGKPYVIENVPGAPLHPTIILCGTMFGLKVYRHRLFESSILLFQPPHPRHEEPTIQRGYSADWTGFVTVAGGQNVPVALAAAAMGIGWMSGRELSQAIPPAYTEYIGLQLLRHIRGTNEEAA